MKLAWDEGDETLVARVLGQGGIYETEAHFAADDNGFLDFLEGECSCPVGFNCKHVAAAVVAAVEATPTDVRAVRATAATARVSAFRAPQPALPTWEQSLQALLDVGSDRGAAEPASGPPLAIELRLDLGGPVKLMARIMRRGRNGWVNGGLSWNGLDSWQVERDDYPANQVRVLRELYALYQSAGGRPRHTYYSSGTVKTIDLTTFDRTLWLLLDETGRAGLRLLHANAALGEVELCGQARLEFDVTQPEGRPGLVLQPRLLVEGREHDLEPVAFLGSGGHGVVLVDRAAVPVGADPRSCRFGLARLITPAPPPLREMVLTGSGVTVPAGEEARFAEEVWPRLRHVAPVGSSDGSFTPPEIDGPRLVLHATYGAGHVVEVTAAWAYTVGATEHRVPTDVDSGAAAYRDLDAEGSLVAALTDLGLGRAGLATATGLVSPVRLSGLGTVRFTTELLPLLQDEPHVEVEVVGEPADFREVSDSLVIGLSTDAAPGETDWFDLGVTISAEGRDLPFVEVFHALAAGETYLLLDDGAYFSLLKPELNALRGLIEEARGLQDQPSDGLRISRYQVDLWDELCGLGVVRHQAEAWERQMTALRSIQSVDADVPDLPEVLKADLRPYQREGFGWLRFLWEYGLGGVLADDMGLGKTLQALALVCHARQADPDLPPFLVVAPTSVVPNWATEAERFAPDLRVATITGTLKRSGRSIHEAVAGAHIVVTTYTLLRLEVDVYGSVPWAGMVLDEAQNAKNHHSKTYVSIRRVSAPFRLAITGTPMENNLMELWSLLSIAAPGLFPNPTRFAEAYARPIERQGDTELLAQLRRRIKPLMKRRTKEFVAADLPPKQEQVLEVELHPQHRKLYQTHLQRERQKVLGLLGDFDRNRFTILRSITRLRQLSLHPALVDKAKTRVPCAKLDTLAKQLGEIGASGHRALVFSQFTGFLGLVRERLDREGIGYCYLDGRTRNRDAAVRRFKDGTDPVFLISLKAGGVGLNLTEADYCFLLDPWWNPATEAQAVDRTHRIGQTQNVMVYRLIARDTIEEKVMALKQRKAELFRGVMDNGDLFSGAIDADDVRALFG